MIVTCGNPSRLVGYAGTTSQCVKFIVRIVGCGDAVTITAFAAGVLYRLFYILITIIYSCAFIMIVVHAAPDTYQLIYRSIFTYPTIYSLQYCAYPMSITLDEVLITTVNGERWLDDSLLPIAPLY